jgi:hypothetical protein
MMFTLKNFVKGLVVSWAERIKDAESERQREYERELSEAEDYVIEKITGGHCVHAMDDDKRLVYCDDCPIGNLRGELSYGASLSVCSRTRYYSK